MLRGHLPNDYILYDNGNLYYDANGNDAGDPVLFAKLVGVITGAVDASDFVVA